MQMEELSNHLINDPTLLKRKENANDCMTSTWQGPEKNTEPFIPRSQQVRQRKGQQVEGNEEYDYAVDPNTGWRFYKGSRENCRQLRRDRGPICRQLRHRRQSGTKTPWKTSNWNSQHSSSPDDWSFFSESGQVSVALEKNLHPTDGECEQYTHKYSTYRVAHSMITFHHASTREH